MNAIDMNAIERWYYRTFLVWRYLAWKRLPLELRYPELRPRVTPAGRRTVLYRLELTVSHGLFWLRTMGPRRPVGMLLYQQRLRAVLMRRGLA